MTWHDISQLTTLPHLTSPHNQPHYFIAPCNQPHQNRSPHHHGTAEGSFTQTTRFGHRSGWSPCAHSIGKYFLWLIVFFFETSAPGLPGSTCIETKLETNLIKSTMKSKLFSTSGRILRMVALSIVHYLNIIATYVGVAQPYHTIRLMTAGPTGTSDPSFSRGSGMVHLYGCFQK